MTYEVCSKLRVLYYTLIEYCQFYFKPLHGIFHQNTLAISYPSRQVAASNSYASADCGQFMHRQVRKN